MDFLIQHLRRWVNSQLKILFLIFSQIFLKVASNENDGAIVRGSLARNQSSKSPFHLPPLRVNQQIEDDSTDESGEIGFPFCPSEYAKDFFFNNTKSLILGLHAFGGGS